MTDEDMRNELRKNEIYITYYPMEGKYQAWHIPSPFRLNTMREIGPFTPSLDESIICAWKYMLREMEGQ